MSKAAKRSLFILMALLVATLGFAAVSFFNLQKTEQEKAAVEQDLADARNQLHLREKQYAQNTAKLEDEIKKGNSEKARLADKIKETEREAEQQVQELSAQIDNITNDRDKWKRRIDTIREERDQLMAKIEALTKKLEEKPEPQVIYKEREPEAAAVISPPPSDVIYAPDVPTGSGKAADEDYWAGLLKEKASLEIDIQKLKDELSAKSIEVVELKQNNENLRLEVDALKHQKEEVEAGLQHKSDMLDNISLELARTKNDKKFIADRVEKLNAENGSLRQQVKQLVSVKNALEKSVVRLSQEKDKIEGRLGQTETLIQSKIDEIWEIKDDLDRSIREAQSGAPANEVELPPIVVSADGQATHFNTGETIPGLDGRIISINEANNFVIVDAGESAGVRLGDSLSVYRDAKYIARLEVIQVRKDISAADIKDQWTKVKVGDLIK